MKKEIELLREIADEAKTLWDKGGLPLETTHLKNLLTDHIDMNNRTPNTPTPDKGGIGG